MRALVLGANGTGCDKVTNVLGYGRPPKISLNESSGSELTGVAGIFR